jgi:predicted Zn-dependent peptidase
VHHFNFKSIAVFFLFISFIQLQAFSQSGRGRPTNPGRNPSPTTPPQPVSVPEATSVIKQERIGNTSRFALKNGITVIIREEHAYPIATVVAGFKTGLSDETDATRGMTSLAARMLFRGTQFKTAEQIASQTRTLGALMTEDSTFDMTAIHLLTPQDKLKEALAIQADLIQNPLFSAEDLTRELALSEDVFTTSVNAARISKTTLFDATASSLLKSFNLENYSAARLVNLSLLQNPSGVVGQSTVSITREQLIEFYQTHFRPDNLIISVVGDVITFNALVEIQRLYGTFKVKPASPLPTATTPSQRTSQTNTKPSSPAPSSAAKPQPTAAQKQPAAANPTTVPQTTTANPVTANPQAATATPPIETLRYRNERGDTNQSIVNIGFPVAGFNSKEWAALELLNTVVAQGRGSRLHKGLIQEQSLISGLASNYLAFADKGLLLMQLFVQPNTIDKAEAAFFRELNRLRRETPSPSEMGRAKMLLEKRFFEENTDYLSQAWSLARAETAQGGFRAAIDYGKTIRAVTAEDVQRAAAKYFTLTNTSVYEYESNAAPQRTFEATKYAETVSAWASTFAEAVDAKQVRAAEEIAKTSVSGESVEKSADELGTLESMLPLEVKNYSTLNGPPAYVKENHTKPIVTVGLLFQGGRMIEDETNGGVTGLMLRSMLYGSTKRPQAITQLEQLGAEIEIVNENDFYGLLLSVLSPNAESAMKIVRDIMEDPAFDDESIKKAMHEQLGLIQRDRLSTLLRSRELLNQALFPNHTYSFSTHGREEVLNKITGDYVRDWHSHTVKRQFPLIIIVGDTNGSALISSEVVSGFRRSEVDSSLKARTIQATKPEEKILQQRLTQTNFTLGFLGPKGDSDEVLALALIKAVMNGRNGRLISELRNKQGLAFNAWLDYQAMKITGAIYASFNSTVENESRARSALIAELEKLGKGALSAEDLSSAQSLATVLNTLRLQNHRANAIEYARAVSYQKPVAEVDAVEEKLNKLTAEDVKRVFSAYFKPTSLSTGIVRGTQAQKATSQ